MLFMTAKIQNLNGTHNSFNVHRSTTTVVYDCKDTKFEWNSQLAPELIEMTIKLFMTAKIQNLNGTHNRNKNAVRHCYVVYDCKDTKFEWNSQLLPIYLSIYCCCL